MRASVIDFAASKKLFVNFVCGAMSKRGGIGRVGRGLIKRRKAEDGVLRDKWGKKLCEHGRRRNRCKDCGGASICEHGRQRSRCKDCKAAAAVGSEVGGRGRKRKRRHAKPVPAQSAAEVSDEEEGW